MQFQKDNFLLLQPEIIWIRDVAQPGSALRSGRRGREFESRHPDLILKVITAWWPFLRKRTTLVSNDFH